MATPTATSAPPVHKVRVGRIEGAVWEHDGENGPRHSVTFQKSYRLPEKDRGKQDNGWRRTTSFGRDDCLILAEVARQAALWISQQEQSQGVDNEGSAKEVPF